MIEAEITCLARAYRLPDVGLSMVKDQIAYLPEEIAQASEDIARGRRARGISVNYIQRVTTRRPALSKAPNREYRPLPPIVLKDGSTLDTSSLLLDVDQVADQVVTSMAGVVHAEFQAMLPSLETLIRSVVKQEVALISVRVASPGSVDPVGRATDDAPLFIPAKIGSGLKADIDVVASADESTGVADAAAALKAARTGKKRKSK